MSCKCAKFDGFQYDCEITGDACMYLFPNELQCAIDYEEGPKAELIQKLKAQVLEEKISIDNLRKELKCSINIANEIKKCWLEEKNKIE